MDIKKEQQRIVSSAQRALKELDKLILQEIDLDELDPEKAKAAAQGKIEAIEGSYRILDLIARQLDSEEPEDAKKQSFLGVESLVKK